VPKTKLQIGEGRRLTAAWLNVMAAGIISAGTIPVLTALALEGWGSRARALLLLPCFAFALGLALHLVGRLIVREKRYGWPGKRLRFDVGLSSRSAFEEPLNCTRCTFRLQSCLPPTWLSRFICRISAGRSASVCGRPPLVRDFYRQ
jgi:hypothetical protein